MAVAIIRGIGPQLLQAAFAVLTRLRTFREPPDDLTKKTLHDVIGELNMLIAKKIRYFMTRMKKSRKAETKYVGNYEKMSAFSMDLQNLADLVAEVRQKSPLYDLDELHPGNGYRSFVSFADTVCLELLSVLRKNSLNERKFNTLCEMIASLKKCFTFLISLMERYPEGDLFDPDKASVEELFMLADTINQECFYGEYLGIQYDPSFATLLPTISTQMIKSAYEFYGEPFFKRTIKSFTNKQAKMIRIYRHAGVDFIKHFWKLSEHPIIIALIKCTSPIAVSRLIHIEPSNDDDLSDTLPISKRISVRLISAIKRRGMPLEPVEAITAEPMSPGLLIHVHGGGFISQSARSQEGFLRNWAHQLGVPIMSIDYSLAPDAPFPQALEEIFYAYRWALKYSAKLGSTGERIVMAGDSAGANLIIGVVQACIGRSIPIPDGLFLAYVPVLVSFTLSPSRLLGLMDPFLPVGFTVRSTRAYAGGRNIPTETESDVRGEMSEEDFERSIELDNLRKNGPMFSKLYRDAPVTYIKEGKPKSELVESIIILASPIKETENDPMYASFSVHLKLVQIQMIHCVRAATSCPCEECASLTFLDQPHLKLNKDIFNFSLPKDRFLSPFWAPDDVLSEFPPICMCSATLDPCLDDTVMFARKLRNLGKPVELDIFEGLPHGFLNFSVGYKNTSVSEAIKSAADKCVKRIKDLLDLPSVI